MKSITGGIYEIEIEGNKQLKDVSTDDILVGLEAGLKIEARMPGLLIFHKILTYPKNQ
jgi:hypothetical protein